MFEPVSEQECLEDEWYRNRVWDDPIDDALVQFMAMLVVGGLITAATLGSLGFSWLQALLGGLTAVGWVLMFAALLRVNRLLSVHACENLHNKSYAKLQTQPEPTVPTPVKPLL